MMKRFGTLWLAILVLEAGCVMQPGKPEVRSISGCVIAADTGQPLAKARISFRSDGRPRLLMPFRIAADVTLIADREGKFSTTARFFDEVEASVTTEDYYQTFRLGGFPESGRLEAVVLKVSKKKPNHTAKPTSPSRGGSS